MEENKRSLMVSILSLSLLTVMAGAAVAPALGVISANFSGENPLLIQLIISIPAVFIVMGNLIFPKLAKRLGAKSLVLLGLALYVVGGCAAGLFDNIWLLLSMRALVGLGVGVIMPLSTGLLVYYFSPGKLESLMGYSSAMNQMGGVAATLLSGLLANISWRASFLVYLMGLPSIALCLLYIKNDNIGGSDGEKTEEESGKSGFKTALPYAFAMFLLMTAFFVYPANFAMISTASGVIPAKYISVVMAGMDLVAFFGGLAFASIRIAAGKAARLIAPLLFAGGYALLGFLGGAAATLLGSALIGFANGCGIPYIISAASKKAGRNAATTVMPFISAALYLAQFLCPFFVSLIGNLAAGSLLLPYYVAAAVSALFFLWSLFGLRD